MNEISQGLTSWLIWERFPLLLQAPDCPIQRLLNRLHVTWSSMKAQWSTRGDHTWSVPLSDSEHVLYIGNWKQNHKVFMQTVQMLVHLWDTCCFWNFFDVCIKQGWGQLHNINSTPTPDVSTPTPIPTLAKLQIINSNSNSGGFNSNSNSNSCKSPEYQLQLQLRRFQLQFQLQSFKSNPNSFSNPILLVQLNYHYPITMWNIVWIKWRCAVDIYHAV